MSASSWSFDPAHSEIGFVVRHMVVSKVRGKFASWDGSLTFDPDNLAASKTEATIDVKSIDTGVSDRDDHLRSADFFDADNHPHITFESKRVEPKGEGAFRLVGDLTIRGTTQEIALDGEFLGKAKDPWGNIRAGFTAKASISRKSFGLTWNQALESGGVLVGDKVQIELDVEATRDSE